MHLANFCVDENLYNLRNEIYSLAMAVELLAYNILILV